VLEKEIERTGIPTVLITSLIPTAKMLGANRIVQGVGITNPLGNPRVSQEEEKALRRRILSAALQLLTEKIEDGKVVTPLEIETHSSVKK
jgi:glycine reductase